MPLLRSNNLALLLTMLVGIILLGASAALAVRIAEDRNLLSWILMAAWLGMVTVIVRDERSVKMPWRAIGIAVVAAFALRIYAINFVSDVALGADPMNYANLARALLRGEGLVTDDWQYGNDLRAYFPPLYPLMLAAWWSVAGDSPISTLLFNTAIDAGTAYILFAILRRRGFEAAGWIAALLYFSYPAFAFAAPLPQKEGLTLLLLVALLYRALIWAESAQGKLWPHAAWIGGLWALLGLTQPSLVLAPVAMSLLLMVRHGPLAVIKLGLAAAPFFILVAFPWWYRNWQIFGEFVPFTTASGFMRNVSLGACSVPFPQGLFELSETGRSRQIGALANARTWEVPFCWLRENLTVMARGFAYEEASLNRFRHTSPPISMADRAIWTATLQLPWVVMLAATVAATWHSWRHRREDLLIGMATILLLAIVATGIWFEFGERHRLALTPLFLMIIACWLAPRGVRTAVR